MKIKAIVDIDGQETRLMDDDKTVETLSSDPYGHNSYWVYVGTVVKPLTDEEAVELARATGVPIVPTIEGDWETYEFDRQQILKYTRAIEAKILGERDA